MESLGIISSNNGETFNERILSYSETYKIKKEKNKKRISEFRKNQDVAENVTRYSAESIPHKVNKSKVNRIEVNKEINKESFIVSENKNFVDPEPENKPEPPPKKKPPEPKKIKKLFRESEFYDIDRLSLALMGTAYQEANVRYYHESALNWSESNGEKKMDWLATLKNWMARDMTAGKFITNDFKISQKNGNSKQQNGKQPTGSEVSTSSIARTITELYYGAGNDGKR